MVAEFTGLESESLREREARRQQRGRRGGQGIGWMGAGSLLRQVLGRVGGGWVIREAELVWPCI